ncbi:MAG TPA: phosphotransferase [Solimonas sp.]|nr:phosphotransferase [Solimonas sp.]
MSIDKLAQLPIPRDWKLSAEWMTAVVSRHHPGARVASVTRTGGSDGTSSRAVFKLAYSEGAGPTSLFAKTKGNWLRRAFQWMTENAFIEGRLVESGVALPLEHPKFYFGAVDRIHLNDMVVMEDVLQRGATLNDATRPLKVKDVENGLRGLARLHSRYWGYTQDTHPQLGWVRPWKASRSFKFLVMLGCRRGIPKLGAHLPAQVTAMGAKAITDCWVRHLNSVNLGPMTLLHGDAHVGNTYSLPDGALGFFDWAVMRRGHWSFDVGYFIVSALAEDDRRRHAADLVELYRQALEIPEQECPTKEEAWLRFRSSMPYGLAIWITTGAEDHYQKPEICANLSRRFASAFLELDTEGALQELGF